MSLIEEAKNKSPDAFDQLMRTQLQRMYRIAISILQNEEDAADAIQETVLRCWEKIGHGSTAISVKAYISHMEKIRNMENEEIIDLYENVFQYARKHMSRALSEDEEKRFSELYDLYCSDMAEPSGEVMLISSKDAYMGQGIAFSTEDGILYIPENEIYINYYSANTETSFFSRELTFDELGRRKVLKMLYKNRGKFPEHMLSDEELLELIDFQIKAEYCRQRIEDEINRGIRSDWSYAESVERERIVTLDPDMKVDETILAKPWLAAYEEVLNQYYEKNSEIYENPERYYANVRFIYLNDDEIPEMLFSHGFTDFDYDDQCNRRNYLYTYKDGEAVLLAPGENTTDDFYGYEKPFSYVERKGMVYCDYHYIYDFSTYDNETDVIDSVKDKMSRMDTWDFDTMTCTSSAVNIEMLHAVYNNADEEYNDADFHYEYYVNVSDIIRDETTGQVRKIIGEKVDRKIYEATGKSLWNGEQITTLSVNDFDKIYSDDNLAEALAKCYLKLR